MSSIYPIDIPDIEVLPGLDFLLLELPSRYMPFMPNGVGYVHNLLKMENISFQTIDANIIWYHRYHSQRILDGLANIVTPSGYIMKEDPWDNTNTDEWDKREIIEYFSKDIDEIVSGIVKMRPRILGLSLNCTNRLVSQEVVNRVRDLYPEIIVLVGGYDCNNYEASPMLFKNYDYMVIGEAEMVLGPLVRALLSGDRPGDLPGVVSRHDSPGRTWKSAPLMEDLDAVDFPRYDWTDIRIYQDYKGYNLTPVTASRGCNWSKCAFCAECFPWRRRNPQKVADEFEWLNQQDFTVFQFNESDMNGDPDALMDICREIIKRNLNIIITGQLRIDRRNTEEFFNLLKKAGCSTLRFGVDGWSKNPLRLQKKGYTMQVVEDNLKNCHKAGIHVTVNMVLGVPGETEEDIDEMINNIIRLKDYIDSFESINTLILAAGSEYYNHPERHNIFFRIDRETLYKRKLRFIPPTLWYSENPYIDHEVRLRRLHKIYTALYENKINIGPFAQERIKAIENELGTACQQQNYRLEEDNDFKLIRYLYNNSKGRFARETVPILIGNCKGFNITYFENKLYIAKEIGDIDLTQESHRNHPNIKAVNDIEEAISYIVSSPIYSEEPQLIGSYRGFNIVRYRYSVYAVNQSLGELDLTREDHRSLSGVFKVKSWQEAGSQIDSFLSSRNS
ncbi:MAG: B12-binding domain-containing radical SAM protein [Bacillota bacterium]